MYLDEGWYWIVGVGIVWVIYDVWDFQFVEVFEMYDIGFDYFVLVDCWVEGVGQLVLYLFCQIDYVQIGW